MSETLMRHDTSLPAVAPSGQALIPPGSTAERRAIDLSAPALGPHHDGQRRGFGRIGRRVPAATPWYRAVRRHTRLRQHRLWRIGVISATGALMAIPMVSVPLFATHPFVLLYAYVVFAAWYGTVRESGGAVLIGGAAVAALRPGLPGLPVEAVIFTLASLMLVLLVQTLRRAHATAREAQRQAEEALRAAVEAVRVRDDVLTTVSHDLKNPLAAIKGQAQVLARRSERAGGANVRGLAEGLANIDISASKMTRLLDELLDVAQVQTGRLLALHRQPTDLIALLRETLREYQAGTEVHHLELRTGEESLVGLWDAARLERVAGNLLSNALKYSPTGGAIVVTARRDPSGWAVMEVQDHGMGIPAAALPRIFERFARAGNVGRISGTGVGLAVVRQIVHLHGGTIDVDSVEGAGTRFTVRLPLSLAQGHGERGR
ncbi:MAG: hypothetical protein NVSMB65_16660 [Chloroflexota bacterium]